MSPDKTVKDFVAEVTDGQEEFHHEFKAHKASSRSVPPPVKRKDLLALT